MKNCKHSFIIALLLCLANALFAQEKPITMQIDDRAFNPSTLMWYTEPAKVWESALPVGNGRLGAMVFGKTKEERVQLNEDTYWSGGPYSTLVKGGYKALPEVQRLIFEGQPLEAHKLFGRTMMGIPATQQKYQPLADIYLIFEGHENVTGYKRWLDLETGIAGVEYTVEGVTYCREVLASVPDQTVQIRITSNKQGALNFRAQLRATSMDNAFLLDGAGNNAIMINGKNMDYMGIQGKLKYKAQMNLINEGGSVNFDFDQLVVSNANAVTIRFVAATNFVNYKDVSADQVARVDAYLNNLEGKSYETVKKAAVQEHKRLFDRVALELPKTDASYVETDKRLQNAPDTIDPSLASLAYNFGRYVLITSSRPGTQAANLQGVWNKDDEPAWSSKYTTNINTEMNYWPAESGNLPECAEPLISLVKDLTDQGAQVAKEHYGASGWVHHQNTDLWRVVAPMDGPTWGTFTVGGAWLVTHLYEHYLYHCNKNYLKEIYPIMKGCVDFFMDFLIPYGPYLVTNPSTSPENPPKAPNYRYFVDEITGMYYFTTICYAATMDMQILHDVFGYYVESAKLLGVDKDFADKVSQARAKLVPPRVGKNGALQEWAEDYDELEPGHRHFSHMYGLYPGNVISAKRTPELVEPCKAVLEGRGDGGTGFSRGWKMALWARLYDGNRANLIFKKYVKEQAYPQLFAKCYTPLQIDGTEGVAAGIAEMLIQSHEGVIDLLPALPDEWADGMYKGVCARGGFEVNFSWKKKSLTQVELFSKAGNVCRLKAGPVKRITKDSKPVKTKLLKDGVIEFATEAGKTYIFVI